MTLKPPPVKTGATGISAFRAEAKLHEAGLTNQWSRQFYRKELAKWQKRYAALASKRLPGASEQIHFNAFSVLCAELLAEFGPELPPKKRMPEPYTPTPITYPDFPDETPYRIHFMEGSSERRQRAVQLAGYAAFTARQTSALGKTILSVGMPSSDVMLYVRLVDAIGEGVFTDFRKAGFAFDYDPDIQVDPASPIGQLWADNNRARAYGWQARALGEQYRGVGGKGLPEDLPTPTELAAWDPDPIWHQILKLTEADRYQDALRLLETIPGSNREAELDEVVYLRFLNESPIVADDVRLLIRKHASLSLISTRLLEEFDEFIAYLDLQFLADPPQLSKLIRLNPDFGSTMLPPHPPASNWKSLRELYASFLNPSLPRGRIFSLNISIGFGDIERLISPHLTLAENAFRRARSIPEIGKGWVSEVALYDLVRDIWPNAVHQWRPAFLGRQSVDVYVPALQLAIEYQGKQHYEPVALFGGKESLRQTQVRDEHKRELLAVNGVTLLEWPYHVEITRPELENRLSALGMSLPKSQH